MQLYDMSNLFPAQYFPFSPKTLIRYQIGVHENNPEANLRYIRNLVGTFPSSISDQRANSQHSPIDCHFKQCKFGQFLYVVKFLQPRVYTQLFSITYYFGFVKRIKRSKEKYYTNRLTMLIKLTNEKIIQCLMCMCIGVQQLMFREKNNWL